MNMETEKKTERGAAMGNLKTAFAAFVGSSTWLLRAHREQLTPERLHELEEFQALGRRVAIHVSVPGYRPVVSVCLVDTLGGLITFDTLDLVDGQLIIT